MAKETANNGFIKIDRSILDWQHFGEPTVVVVFLYLLLKANHKNGWWQGLQCERGATFVGLRAIKEDTKLAINTVRSAISKLVESGEIKRIQVDRHHTKTIITKYAQYQDFSFGSVSKNDTLTDTLTDTKQERKERKEEFTTNKERNAHEEILNWLVNSQYLEQFAMSEGITPELCKKLANDAVMEWNMLGTTHHSVTDARRHMLDRIRKQVGIMRNNGTLKATEDMAKRLQPLIDGCSALVDKGHPKPIVAKFYKDSIQLANDGTGRMKFEALGFWDTEYRFNEFLNREKK